MVNASVHYIESGAGSTVLCFHAALNSAKQWRALMQQLGTSFHVVAVDLYGEGESPPCPVHQDFSIADELDLINPLIIGQKELHLVGHSYGGSVAVQLALKYPDKIKSLIVYEPVLWGWFIEHWPNDQGAKELLSLRESTLQLVGSGEVEQAAQQFIDYWSGAGTWDAQKKIQALLVAGMKSVAFKWKSDIGLNVSIQQLNSLACEIPVHILTGSDSATAAFSLMTHLRHDLKDVVFTELKHMGHMGPITHREKVNAEIVRLLRLYE